ncbi:gamma-glutamyltranspeptidase [Tsuneonella deserti]|uniref:Glutathione hydrolase proenzyme n=1 Tax=Tsuneonella deserti TaxID=2035528 RepID=A0ABQ1SA27_9SPHN|nr:gamma-glutamyltransferase [Tsuneonella deserti]GGE04275.1 gamma-glutamyltranspeptidase [Tsuneonella deserti]
MARRFLLSAFALPLLAGCATLPAPVADHVPPGDAAAPATGLVSAADPRAVEAGMAMLRQGGSATDAAIATMLALTVVEPQSSGIGGGGFFVRGDAAGHVSTIDGRETAPAGATGDWFFGPNGKPLPFPQAQASGLSVGVPGNLRLAARAHKENGKLPWSALFAPAIALARDGFAISPRLHDALDGERATGARDADGRALFYDPGGQALPVGTTVRNPALASTMQRLASDGADAFYEGAQARAIAAEVAADTPRPRPMTVTDVTSYSAKDRPPVCGTYRTYRICGMGPPSSGATTVYAILKQLERFDLQAMGPDSPTFWHLFAESQRLAYADREKFSGDADFVTVPVAGMTDPDYLAARGSLIAADRTMPAVTAGPVPGALALADGDEPEEHGTSHFVAIDRWGNGVSYTSTIESAFGSGLVVDGFYLNNELTDFSNVPSVNGVPVANRVEGGKRPRSSMSPTLVYDAAGRLMIAVGAAGGATIPVQTAKNLIAMIDFGLAPDRALALPVLFSPGDTVIVEEGTSLAAMAPALRALGHKVEARRLPLKANAARRIGGAWVGAADPRSEGAWKAE